MKRRKTRRKTRFHLRLKELGFRSYTAYLKSEHWLEFRNAYFVRHKRICFCCGEPSRDLHHITYEYLGKERQKDVKPLCRKCHKKVHKLVKKNVLLSEAHKVLKEQTSS